MITSLSTSPFSLFQWVINDTKFTKWRCEVAVTVVLELLLLLLFKVGRLLIIYRAHIPFFSLNLCIGSDRVWHVFYHVLSSHSKTRWYLRNNVTFLHLIICLVFFSLIFTHQCRIILLLSLLIFSHLSDIFPSIVISFISTILRNFHETEGLGTQGPQESSQRDWRCFDLRSDVKNIPHGCFF